MTNNTSASTGSKYRTQTRAGLIAAVPDSIATITHPDYQYALSIYKSADLCNKAAAYIVPSGSNDGISATYMHLNSFDSNPEQTYKRNSLVVEADTCKSVESKSMLVPNTHMLAAIFSFFQLNYKNKCDSSIIFGNTMDFTINIYIPSFMYYIGGRRNFSESQKQSAIRCLREFDNYSGIIDRSDNGRQKQYRYPVLILHEINESTNTFRISSPYMLELIHCLSIRRTKKAGSSMGKSSVIELPNYTFLVRGSIVTARSQMAAEIVDVIVRLVVQAGQRNIPGITPKTIIDRCPLLKNSFDNCSAIAEKNKLLKRVFSTAWTYLNKYTFLEKRYISFSIPAEIPNINNLGRRILFHHSGINKNYEHLEYPTFEGTEIFR